MGDTTMKSLLIGALVGAQLAVAPPVAAATIETHNGLAEQQRSAFVGGRLRVPFGGQESGRARAALALTSVEHGRFADGRTRTRFAEGIELGLSPNRPLTLSIGGASFAQRLAAGQETPDERQQRTGRAILKGAAVVVIVGAAVIGGLILAFTIACDGNRCSE